MRIWRARMPALPAATTLPTPLVSYKKSSVIKGRGAREGQGNRTPAGHQRLIPKEGLPSDSLLGRRVAQAISKSMTEGEVFLSLTNP